MTATLYGIPGSHAVRTGELMLEHKEIDFRRVNFPPGRTECSCGRSASRATAFPP
jgi:hypothetical protein